MKPRKILSLIIVSSFISSTIQASNIRYADPQAPDSPGYGTPRSAPSVDIQANEAHKQFVNDSGLYANPYNNADTAAAQSSASGGDTYWHKGLEYNTADGVTTGAIDESASAPESAPENVKKTSNKATSETDAAQKDIVSGVEGISTLSADAGAKQVSFVVVGLGELQRGKTDYQTNRLKCHSDQENAEFICREKTNPNLQTAAMAVNGLVATMNTMAVNDSCKTISKVMNVTNLALTTYTATCGALKYKCEKRCVPVKEALLKIKSGLAKAKGTKCIPMNPMAAPACAEVQARHQSYIQKIEQGLRKELNDENEYAIAGRAKLCTHEYAGLLVSAGLGIASVVKSLKDARKCDDDTSTESSASSQVAADSSATTTTTTSTTDAPTSSSSEIAASEEKAAPEKAAAEEELSAQSSTSTPTRVPLIRVGLKSNSRETASSEHTVEADSPYRDYLPGGSKDPLKGKNLSASGGDINKEISSANGKTNFQKMRDRFRLQQDKLLAP